MTKSLWSPEAFEGAPQHPPGVGLVPEPLPATNKQSSKHLGALFLTLDQIETINFLQQKKENSKTEKYKTN